MLLPPYEDHLISGITPKSPVLECCNDHCEGVEDEHFRPLSHFPREIGKMKTMDESGKLGVDQGMLTLFCLPGLAGPVGRVAASRRMALSRSAC
jgi:hypothetical protein